MGWVEFKLVIELDWCDFRLNRSYWVEFRLDKKQPIQALPLPFLVSASGTDNKLSIGKELRASFKDFLKVKYSLF